MKISKGLINAHNNATVIRYTGEDAWDLVGGRPIKIKFGYGVRSEQLEGLILSKPDIFDGWYDNVNTEDGIYEVSMKFGYNVDGVHSIYGRIKDILSDVKRIEKCDIHNCNLNECLNKRGEK